jgi:hypothetical protein
VIGLDTMSRDPIVDYVLRRWASRLDESERRDRDREAPALTDGCRTPDGDCDGSCDPDDDCTPDYLDPETR